MMHRSVQCAQKKKYIRFYLPSDYSFCLLEVGGISNPSSSAVSTTSHLGWAGLWRVKLLPSKEFLKSSQSLFNKSQNQWTATAYYRILSEKCVLLLSARRYRARDASLSSTLDFVWERAVSLPSARHGIERRVLLCPIGSAFFYRSRRAQTFSKKYSFGLESKPNSEGIAHNSWGLLVYGPEQKYHAFENRLSQRALKY